MLCEVFINVTEKWSVMERIVPSPRGEPFVIILTIKLKSLNVFFNNLLKFSVILSILNIKSTLIIISDTIDNIWVLYLKLLNLWALSIISLFLFLNCVEDCFLLFDCLLFHSSLSLHLIDTISLKFFGNFQEMRYILPIYDALIVNKRLMLL